MSQQKPTAIVVCPGRGGYTNLNWALLAASMANKSTGLTLGMSVVIAWVQQPLPNSIKHKSLTLNDTYTPKTPPH